jgi:hypothetical protein
MPAATKVNRLLARFPRQKLPVCAVRSVSDSSEGFCESENLTF